VSLARAEEPLAPGSWLGVIGGGQLGRMFCQAAQSMGYRVCVLDPSAHGPAAAVADRCIVADYEDGDALAQLTGLCAAVTTEFENVPARSLDLLRRACRVCPPAQAVAIAQDRIAEKRFIEGLGIEVARHVAIDSPDALAGVDARLFPGILKTARLGYDGRGQIGVASRAELAAAWQELRAVPCVLERRIAMRRELSVVIARAQDGSSAAFPLSENEHRGGILAVATMPARAARELSDRARAIALRIADGLDYVGVMCVELFELDDGRLLVNEIAPRPHNSGHATIDICLCSQFEQQVRTLAGMPLGETGPLASAVMLNLLGDAWFAVDGTRREPAFARVLDVPGACLHLYGKSEVRRGRKMGHVTVAGANLEQASARAAAVAAALEMPFTAADSRTEAGAGART